MLHNYMDFPYYELYGQFIEDFVSQNYIEFCERWLHLAGFEDMINDIIEYFSSIIHLPQIHRFNRNGNINVVTMTERNVKTQVVSFNEKGFKTKVVSKKIPIIDFTDLRNQVVNDNMSYAFRKE